MTASDDRRVRGRDGPEHMLTAAELASRLGLREATISLLATTGDIRDAIRVGETWLFPSESVDRWLYGANRTDPLSAQRSD